MNLALPIALALLLGLPATAQLDLPDRPARPAAGKEGAREKPRARDRGRSSRRGDDRPALDIGGVPRRPAAGGDGEARPPGEGYSADAEGAARFVLDELSRVRDPDAAVARQAVETLSSLGEVGLNAARGALAAEGAVQLVVAGRLLLRSGVPEDRRRVALRLRRPLPARAAEPLLRALAEADPVLASPRFLIELLDHPTGTLRAAAQRMVAPRLEPGHLALLAAHLQSERTDTRARAVQLIASIEDPAALRVLYDRLADPATRVARMVVDLLAAHPDGTVADELRRLAFEGGADAPVGRRAAYALVTLIEREDAWNTPLIGEEVVDELLLWLRAPEELVSGTAAMALAGIGFRSPRSREMAWLDRDVPHALVRLVSGAVFHRDFSTLREPAQRRLALLSGVDFGSDGAAWQRWWLSVAEDFRARRAVLVVRPEEIASLAIRLDVPRETTRPTLLLGPDADPGAGGPDAGEGPREPRVFYLDRDQCQGLFGLLRSEGVLSASRLPSLTRFDAGALALDVRVAEQGKHFQAPPDRLEPWLERVVSAVRQIEDANRWQLYFDPSRWADQRAFWRSEVAFWRDTTDPRERALHEKELLLEALEAFAPRDRSGALEALARLEEERSVLVPADFADLVTWLEEEPIFGPRPRRLVGLALAAGRRTGPEGGLAASLARRLVEVLAEGFGDGAREEIARVLRAAGEAGSAFAFTAERPIVRACAAELLASRSDEASAERLLELLDDPSAEVEEAAVRALGERREEAARDELHLRARLGRGAVRRAALRAVGRLGGPLAREVLMLGLADADPRVQVAAVEAMADLADPETLGLFVSLFARGSDSPLFAAARRGLIAFGQEAWTEVARLMVTAAPRTRRDAALFLSERGVPEAASTLMALLTDNPKDGRVAAELAVLTGVDFRGESDPAAAWWAWWDAVVHDDALAWFLGGAEREGLAVPAAETLRGSGRLAGGLFLLEVLEQPRLHLVERARRELSRLLGREVETPPARGAARRAWLAELDREVREHWQA